MPMIYRIPLVLRRRQPFADWVNAQTREPTPYTLAEGRPDIYLLHVTEGEPTLEEMLGEYWQDVFEHELDGWMTDEACWPADRTLEMFRAWFDVELGEVVTDLAPDEPLTEDDLDADALDEAATSCAWCRVALGEEEGRHVGFMVQRRDRLAAREGRVFSLVVAPKGSRDDADDVRIVTGVVPPRDSEAAATGDLVFKACNRDCERALRSVVPPALRQALRG